MPDMTRASFPYYEIYMNDELIASSELNEGILNPIVDKAVNTAGSLSFTVLPTHPKWGAFRRFASFIDVLIKGVCVFRGRIINISEDNFKQKNVECEGALAFLMDTHFGAMTSINVRDKIKSVIDTHNTWFQLDDQADSEDSTKHVAIRLPWDYRRCFRLGKIEPEGSKNVLKPIADPSWWVGRVDGNQPVTDPSGDRLISIYDREPFGEWTDKTFTFCFDDLYYSLNHPNDQVVLYFYQYETYLNKLTTNLSFFDNASQGGNYKYRAITLSNVAALNANRIYISIPLRVDGEDIRVLDYNFWLQIDGTNLRSYMMSEHKSETTEHEITGDAFSTLFIQNRDIMFRTRACCMEDLFLGEPTAYDPPDPKFGNYIDALNPNRINDPRPIVFGVNLMEIQKESPDFEPITTIRPLHGGEYFLVTNRDGVSRPFLVENPYYQAYDPWTTWSDFETFGMPRTIKFLEVGENASIATATTRANYYFDAINNSVPSSFKVKALDTKIYNNQVAWNPIDFVSAASMIDVGDPVRIVSESHDLPDNNNELYVRAYVKICLAMKLDIMNPQNNEYTIGDYIPDGDDFEAETLTKKFANEKKKNKKKK